MDERVMQFRVGVMVLASLIIAAILVLLFVGDLPTITQGSYTIYVVFPEAPGVTRDTPVRKNGIRIGRVTDVNLGEGDKGVIVTVKIDGNRKIYRHEVCRLSRSLVLGDVALEFSAVPPRPGAAKTPAPTTGAAGRADNPAVTLAAAEGAEPEEIQGGDTIRGQLDRDLTESVTRLEPKLEQTMESLTAAGVKLGATLDQINRMLAQNETGVNNVVVQADRTLRVVQETLGNANEMLGDPQVREDLRRSIQQLPGVLEDTRNTVKVLGGSINELGGAIRNVEKFTAPLGEQGQELADNIRTTTAQLSQLTDELLKFTRDLNSPQSSLGNLVRDPTLYQSVSRTAKNVEELTRQLRPIVEDARVFSDKIARHPESLGVRGAIQKNPGIK